jgi:hypothetical protein
MIIELGKVTEETQHDGYIFELDSALTAGHVGT